MTTRLKSTARTTPKAATVRLMSLATLLACVTVSGCTAIGDSKGPRTSSSLDSVDIQGLTESQAALALSRAESVEQQGKIDEAVRYYEQARSLDPKLDYVSRRLAVLYDRSGDAERARAAYERALQIQPGDADLLNDYGVYHLHRESWATAEAWFRRCLEVNRTHRRAMNNLAMSLAMQNRLQESYEVFSQVVGQPAAYSNLGVLLTRQGRVAEAREHFQRALASDPTTRYASDFLGALNQPPEATIASKTR
jgi:Tfp pilus assembly protein PilF